MAKKTSKTEQTTLPLVPQEEQTQEKDNNGISDAAAIKEAYQAIGLDKMPKDVKAWVKNRYPSIDVDKASFGSSSSNLRTKLREAAGMTQTQEDKGQTTSLQTQKQTQSKGKTPSASDLVHVARIARGHGGIKELAKMVKVVQDIAQEAGSLDNLTECLTLLAELDGLREEE